MERRALLAIALSLAVLLAWQAFFAPPAPPPSGEGGSPSPPAPAPPATPVASGTPVPPPAAVTGGLAGPEVEVRSPRYQVVFGPEGGVRRWILNYRGPKPLAVPAGVPPLTVGLLRPGDPAPELLTLVPVGSNLLLEDKQEGALRAQGQSRDGLLVERRLRFVGDSYRVEVEVAVEGARSQPLRVALYWTSPVLVPGAPGAAPWVTVGEGLDRQQVLGRVLLWHGGRLSVFEAPGPHLAERPGGAAAGQPSAAGSGAGPRGPESVPPLKEQEGVLPLPPREVSGERGWVALENDYFIAALVATEPMALQVTRDAGRTLGALVFPEVAPAGGRWTGRAVLYAGPKEWERLTALGVGLEQAQARNYGGFPLPLPYGLPMQWFCVPLLWLMNFFARALPGQNYGVAIVALTVLVKILFYPLTRKSMTSMKRMQALQPQINALRARYRSDPQRLQREQMELFRRHRVNPMGGCLPMVVQIPIFYALYLTLQYSVELQGAPFVLWIRDLSRKDPYYVLPILMGASMFVQQKMTPSVGDPRQAKLMLFLPLIFTFMFLEFPTGLVLYWLVNNVLSIAQQYLIERALVGKQAPTVEGKPSRTAGKSA